MPRDTVSFVSSILVFQLVIEESREAVKKYEYERKKGEILLAMHKPDPWIISIECENNMSISLNHDSVSPGRIDC